MEQNRYQFSRFSALLLPLFTVATLISALSTSAAGQVSDSTETRVALAVQALDLENVSVFSFGDTVQVRYENRVFRNPLEALGAVVKAVAPGLPPEARLQLVTLSRGVPVLTIAAPARAWASFMNGSLSVADFRSRTVITDGSAVPARAGEIPGARPSSPASSPAPASPAWRKLDIALRPLAQIELGVPDDPFKFGFWLAPEVTTIPFRGALVTLQGII